MEPTATALPTLIVTLSVWVYWSIVAVKSARRRKRTGSFGGVLPEQVMERVMWAMWLPLVACWVSFPFLAWTHRAGPFALPAFAQDAGYALLRWAGAALAVAALAGSIRGWREMGRNWTMAVTQQEASALITGGMFSRVRHPIYALSILLMLATLVAVPTWPVAVIAAVHVALMITKARNEERFLLCVHGERYASYCRRTGRFIPRAAVAAPAP